MESNKKLGENHVLDPSLFQGGITISLSSLLFRIIAYIIP
jgi:hypothetical protein